MAEATAAPTFDRSAFRKVLGTFATGITVVTTVNEHGVPFGLTANSFTSVSLDPPLVLVCLDRCSNSLAAIRSSGVFAVNILSEEQRSLSSIFASKSADKFAQVEWRKGCTGVPLFPGTVGWVECAVHEIVSAGDHDIVMGHVQDCGQSPLRPLGYFGGGYFLVSHDQDAGGPKDKATFGAIVEHHGSILLHRRSDGTWSLPEATAGGTDLPLGGLLRQLAEAGAPASLDFLYSVAELPDHRGTLILYRGQFQQEPVLKDPASWMFVSEAEIAEVKLNSYETEMTLGRYFKERRQDSFGLFADTGDGGRLVILDRPMRSYNKVDAERDLR